ncbi:MAG: peptidylprolyl isomerase [Syntrophothermus sp.]
MSAIIIFLLSGQVNAQVIATFGKNKITLDEFKSAYLDIIKNPKTFDSKELREKFLDELIATRILAQKVESIGLDKNELWQTKIEAYKNKCLREAHFEHAIKPKIMITENDIEDTYQFTQEERKISNLFFETKTQADSIYRLLINGSTTFEEQARIIYRDTAMANSGGDLGWVYWDQLEYDMGQAAFKLPLNKISEPVKSNFGYHIIKVTDYKKKPLITRLEYEAHRKKTKYLLEYQLGDKYGYEYISNMLHNSNVVVFPPVMKFVEEKLSTMFKRKPNETDQMFEVQLREDEVKLVESNLWDERGQVLATVNGVNFTVSDFMGILNYIPYNIVYSGFRKAFETAIRDFAITLEAKKMGLEKDETVKMKTNLYREFLLALELKRQLVRSVTVNDDEVHKRYDEKKEKFKGATYEQMYETLKSFISGEKKRHVIPDQVKKLMGDMKITKDLKTLHAHYDSILQRYKKPAEKEKIEIKQTEKNIKSKNGKKS